MYRKKGYLYCVIILVMFMGLSDVSYGNSGDSKTEDKTLSPYFLVENTECSIDSFPLKHTNVDVTIDGVIANVFVNQTYRNNGTEPINATYVFPASTKASVHGMKMTIGNKVVYAKIKEREEALQEFEQAKSDGKSASLLEEERPNVFTMKLANIMPNDEVQIELHYSEIIIPTDGIYQFVFPTVVGPRYSRQLESEEEWINCQYLEEGESNPANFNIKMSISSPIPIEKIDSPSHKITSNWTDKTAINISLSNEEKESGNRDFVLDYGLAGEQIESGLIIHEGEDENFFLLMMQPPKRIKPDEITPREYIFVLDVSGSMNGYPLDTAKTLINDLIGKLKASDKFNVVLFAGGSDQFSTTSVQATEKNRKNAIEFIDKQDGSGGTELANALNTALKIPGDDNYSRSFVIITDGYISEEKETFKLIDNNIGKANFFAFGIGSSVNRYLIEGIAKAGLGEAFIVTEESEAQKTVDKFREYIESPILTNIEVNYNGIDVYDVEPGSIPTMFSERPLLIYGKWKGELSGSIEITGQLGTNEYENVIELNNIEPIKNSALPYLWARKSVERLSDYNLNLSGEDNKEEITYIGLKYNILTQYTSFIAVIEEIRNIGGESTDVNQPLPLPENVSNYAIGYTGMSEPHDIMLFAIVLGIFFVVLLKRKARLNEK